jgi:hypothetical protein
MRTVFVNPNPPRKRRKRRKTKKRKVPGMARKRTIRRKRATPKRRRRTRRRNAGVTAFTGNSRNNPLILQNPRRRRRRRKNPQMNLKTFINKTLTYSGGAAVGAGLNILALRRIENDWARNGARLAAAVASGMFLKGEMGAAAAGATLYPLFAELALMTNLVPASEPTEADLHELAADLEAALDDIDLNDSVYDSREMYVP